MSNRKVPVEVSARHVHLSRKDVDTLFGEGYELTPDKWLSQPGQYISKERVNVIGKKRSYQNVGIIGPIRKDTQFELAMTDCFFIGAKGTIRESGDIEGTAGIRIESENASIETEKGVIVAKRHIHMTEADAKEFGVKDKQIVKVRIDGVRPVEYGEVVIRVSDSYAFAMHVDTDEGNAASVGKDTFGEIIID